VSEARTGEGRTRSGRSPKLLRRVLLVCAFAAAGLTGFVALAFAAPPIRKARP
jgi:hypothetical protein